MENNRFIDTFNRDFGVNSYDPFGTTLEGRNWQAGSEYRYGFNGQEQDDEVYGDGNLNTAEFWEYDTRLGRRFNLDPKPISSTSSYSCFLNNPISFVDILGDTTMLFKNNGKYIGTINDNLENQVHYFGWFSFILCQADYNNREKKGQEYLNGLATEMRSKSTAFMGKNTIESLNLHPYIDTETGGVLMISASREILAVDKTEELNEKVKAPSSTSFPMGGIEKVLTNEKEPIGLRFGTYHWHPGDWTKPTNYNDPEWQGWARYRDPDDYYGYLSNGKDFKNANGVTGGHMAIIVTTNYISIYQTMKIKFDSYIFKVAPVDESERDAQGKYKVVKKTFFTSN